VEVKRNHEADSHLMAVTMRGVARISIPSPTLFLGDKAIKGDMGLSADVPAEFF